MTMPTIPELWSVLNGAVPEILGWTLLHFVWQGALLAAVLGGMLRLLHSHTPRVRYVVSCLALFGLLALPVATGVWLRESGQPTTAVTSKTVVITNSPEEAAPASRSAATPTAPVLSSWQAWAADWLRPAVPWIAFAWGVGVMIFSVRLAGGAWHVRRLRRTSSAAPEEWQDRLRSLVDRMGMDASVSIRQSTRINGPIVLGWWRPAILVPVGLLSGLPPKQVEALLLHEIAHIRRHDVLVSRLQALAEVLLFFHPATWWVSRQVRQTREACCDDLAVRCGTDRTIYARALTSVAERAVGRPSVGWAPSAGDGSLLTRIRRVLSPKAVPSSRRQWLTLVVSGLVLVGLPAGLAACASQHSATEGEDAGVERTAHTDGPFAPKDSLDEDEKVTALFAESDSTKRSLNRQLRGLEQKPVHPDSLTGALLDPLNPDSFEAAVRLWVHPDSVDLTAPRWAEGMQLEPFSADSLRRALQQRINPDSLEREIRAQINADSLERVLRRRFNADSLKQRILRMSESTVHADSLVRRHTQRSDSLRNHLDSLAQHWERRRADHLRNQARELKERAERLEERAEEMEESRKERSRGASPDSLYGAWSLDQNAWGNGK